jgi:hypothetical protein
MLSNEKIDAIYDLREAVEAKVHAEHALEVVPSAATRQTLLDATLDVEAKTQAAIDVCHECGLSHAAEDEHGAPPAGSNVISVYFSNGNGEKDQPV